MTAAAIPNPEAQRAAANHLKRVEIMDTELEWGSRMGELIKTLFK